MILSKFSYKSGNLLWRSPFLVLMLLMLEGCSSGIGFSVNNQHTDTDTNIDKVFDLRRVTPELITYLNIKRINRPVYKIGVADILVIKVWENFALDGNAIVQSNATLDTFVVQNDGTIFYPYIGKIQVSNKSTSEIQILITKKLSKFVKNPQISVEISEFNSQKISVIGEVRKPGFYPITKQPTSLLDAITSSEINNTTSDPSQIYIIRANKALKSIQKIAKPSVYQFDARSAENLLLAGRFFLQDKDIIFIAPAGLISWNRALNALLPTIRTSEQIKDF